MLLRGRLHSSFTQMKETEKLLESSISKARSMGEIADFWDTHSIDDYWDQTKEVTFEIRAPRRRRISLDSAIYSSLEALARARGIQAETLANLWIAEKIKETRPGE